MIRHEAEEIQHSKEVSDLLYRYLRAWTDQSDLGESAFDDCATVRELADLLASKVTALLT